MLVLWYTALASTPLIAIPISIMAKDMIPAIANPFDTKETKVDFNTVVKLIENYVLDLNSIIYQIREEALITEVVDKLDLFSSVGEIKDKETAKKQVVNLASYLLFNQLLFYNIYKSKTKNKALPELDEIKEIDEIYNYFSKITDIDYQSIYNVNILDYIPRKPIVLETLNDVIKAIKLVRAENITHDLLGRFFHDLIPFEVRKILAAFYTNPTAADLLSRLTIDKWDAQVIDPACGSGTLLVSAYRRKQKLYKSLGGYKNLKEIHKQFLEQDLTGIDIMPFAAHLSTINLAMQDIEQETNIVRIATTDSLDIVSDLQNIDFNKEGIKISPYTTYMQSSLDGYTTKLGNRKSGSVSPKGKGTEFYIKPIDVVIMNPPFSDRDKMPKEMRKKLSINPLSHICGNQVNLWGYFLGLADLLLKPEGKIGAVIPINIARGGASQKIRDFMLDNYHIEYIVKPVVDIAFSEGAAFRDILFIAKKKSTKNNDKTKILFLNKHINKIREDDIEKIINLDKEFVELREITSEDLHSYRKNFMPLLLPKNLLTLSSIIEKSSKFKDFETNKMEIGLPFRPKGVADGVFITTPIDESRIKNAVALLDKKSTNAIKVRLKDIPAEDFLFTFKSKDIKPAIRTNTGIKRISLRANDIDYILIKENLKYLESLRAHGVYLPMPFPWKKHVYSNIPRNGSYLILPRKIRMDSPNTNVISIFSEEKLYGFGPSLWYINDIEKEQAKLLNMYFNSIFSIIQIIMYKSETLGGAYFEIMKNDWSMFKVLDISKLNDKERRMLLSIFNKLKDVEFPSILEQLDRRFWARLELDKAILKVVGVPETTIEVLLNDIYDSVLHELNYTK